MAEQIRKTTAQTEPSATQTGAEIDASTKSGQRIKAELDDLLDEIDEVLETNAEDFVNNYVQKGGQ
ncbi:MAG: ubiquitin-like protein Pup [Ilumatobacteraceae bacterium]|nr:ubiquitin-like protein Pup [Ilumatobacteraceae bacterium]